eukprot:m.325356 g.325356  ORF g.325356 m.325356 type:complete len:701 (-) comp19734_c0_seq12:1393-3495(-)
MEESERGRCDAAGLDDAALDALPLLVESAQSACLRLHQLGMATTGHHPMSPHQPSWARRSLCAASRTVESLLGAGSASPQQLSVLLLDRLSYLSSVVLARFPVDGSAPQTGFRPGRVQQTPPTPADVLVLAQRIEGLYEHLQGRKRDIHEQANVIEQLQKAVAARDEEILLFKDVCSTIDPKTGRAGAQDPGSVDLRVQRWRALYDKIAIAAAHAVDYASQKPLLRDGACQTEGPLSLPCESCCRLQEASRRVGDIMATLADVEGCKAAPDTKGLSPFSCGGLAARWVDWLAVQVAVLHTRLREAQRAAADAIVRRDDAVTRLETVEDDLRAEYDEAFEQCRAQHANELKAMEQDRDKSKRDLHKKLKAVQQSAKADKASLTEAAERAKRKADKEKLSLIAQLEKCKTDLNTAVASLGQAQDDGRELLEQQAQLRGENEQLRVQLHQMTDIADTARREIDGLTKTLESTSKQANELQALRSQLQEANALFKSASTDADNAKQSARQAELLAARVFVLEAELAAAKTSFGHAQEENTSLADARGVLQRQVQALQDDQQSLLDQLEELEDKAQESTHRFVELELELASQADTLADREEMISALQLQLQQGQQSGGPCPRCLSREERLQHVDGSHAVCGHGKDTIVVAGVQKTYSPCGWWPTFVLIFPSIAQGNQDEVDAQSDPYPLAGPTPMWRKGGQGEPG